MPVEFKYLLETIAIKLLSFFSSTLTIWMLMSTLTFIFDSMTEHFDSFIMQSNAIDLKKLVFMNYLQQLVV